MDSAEFLDLLGNANRRRILQLLSQKPCYVTEISEHLGVSPKAVIDHLSKLESAGLVESRTDERRRKYFSISRHVQLEVTVSPYEYGTRSAYPENTRFDVGSCRRVQISLETVEGRSTQGGIQTADLLDGDTATLARRLRDLEQLERELSLLHRWTEGRITQLRERLSERVAIGDPRLVSELLVALAEQPREIEALSRHLGVPPVVVEELLDVLAGDGVVTREGRQWQLAE